MISKVVIGRQLFSWISKGKDGDHRRCVRGTRGDAPPKKVRVRKPRPKPAQTAESEPPPPPAVVVDAPFFAALGGTLRGIQRDERLTKLSSLRTV